MLIASVTLPRTGANHLDLSGELMKHLTALALVAFATACAPVDDQDLAPTGSNAESATVGNPAPVCTSPGVCYDPTVGIPSGGYCAWSPRTMRCVSQRITYARTPVPIRTCNSARDCARVDVREPDLNRVRAYAVNATKNNLAALTTWQAQYCGNVVTGATNNVVTDDGATSGTVILSCCGGYCITRR